MKSIILSCNTIRAGCRKSVVGLKAKGFRVIIPRVELSAIQEVGASSMKDMGKIMPVVMPKIKVRANGGIVNKLSKRMYKLVCKILRMTNSKDFLFYNKI